MTSPPSGSAATADDEIRVIVLQANGEQAFSTGVDRKEGRFRHPNPFSEDDPGFFLGAKQNRVWKPLICALHGMVAGGAFYWLSEADVVICSDDTTFFDPHTTYGMASALEPIAMLRRMPMGEVLRIALFGLDERMGAARALAVGLVSEIVSRDDLRDRAKVLAERLAAKPPLAVQATVKAIWDSLDMSAPRRREIPLLLSPAHQPAHQGRLRRVAAAPLRGAVKPKRIRHHPLRGRRWRRPGDAQPTRPRQPWSGPMAVEYRWALHHADTDPDVRVVVLTGAGRSSASAPMPRHWARSASGAVPMSGSGGRSRRSRREPRPPFGTITLCRFPWARPRHCGDQRCLRRRRVHAGHLPPTSDGRRPPPASPPPSPGSACRPSTASAGCFHASPAAPAHSSSSRIAAAHGGRGSPAGSCNTWSPTIPSSRTQPLSPGPSLARARRPRFGR